MSLKLMAKSIPYGACPNCGHKQFVVIQTTTNIFLTNRDGEITDGCELADRAVGKCGNCGKEMEMFPTRYGFIPLTPLRKIVYEACQQEKHMGEFIDTNQTNNPMLSKEDKL